MHVAKINIQGNSLVGLYILPMNDVVLIGQEVPESLEETLKEVFKAPLLRLSIAGASLIGMFAATDGESLLVPSIIFPHEEEVLKEHDISYTVISTTLTCLGNNIFFHNNAILVNPDFSDEVIAGLKETFQRPVYRMALGEITTIGSLLVARGNFGLVSHDISQKEFDTLQNYLGINIMTGTVNMGSINIASGIAVNKNGFVIGDQSGGPELVNADEALGFREQ
jgi:translation initiation factor 6